MRSRTGGRTGTGRSPRPWPGTDFATGEEADKVVRGRMWAKIDVYAHKARAVDLTVPM
ncbi:MAG TPA: hypothetical protein VEC60_06910 [Reyranella sp.]|nr:hypothetical protein [Reyranella sp.]